MILTQTKKRECYDCDRRLKTTEDYVKVVKNIWTANGISNRLQKTFCIECATKRGLIDA